MAERTTARVSRWPEQRGADADAHRRRWASSANWPLRIGGTIALLVILVACFGPALAPHDPLEQTYATRIRGIWRGPPFPPFASWSFPLGSDQFGRDLYSRLLWGVRPTMIMVICVALARLLLGTLVGLLVGWWRNWFGRLLDAIITGALAVPILIVALGAITAVGIERGLIAFIFGLALTGWAETGRIIGAQVRSIKQQPFIESARALGASTPHVLIWHVLRHVTPMLGMLLAFEISSTLLVAGALGFLGYYIGGGVAIQVGDFVTETAIGLPELGQMLAQSLVRLTQPWAMIVIGAVVFVIILGFNLLGEGLRRALNPERVRRRSRLSLAIGRVGKRVGAAAGKPVTHAGRLPAWALLLAVVIAVGGGAVWTRMRSMTVTLDPVAALPAASKTVAPLETGAALPAVAPPLWSSERRDAQGALWTPVSTIAKTEPRKIFQDPAGEWVAGPAVAADGTIYLASKANTLYALEPSGAIHWQAQLPAAPVGAPALSGAGEIYVAHVNGSLSAWGADGAARWTFQTQPVREATSGPIVAPDGTIFYTIVDSIQAVTPNGASKWLQPVADRYLQVAPRLSPSGDLVFLKAAVLSAHDGAPREVTVVSDPGEEFRDPSYITGADGQTYYVSGHSITAWSVSGSDVEVGSTIMVEDAGPFAMVASDAGMTHDGLAWFLHSSRLGSPEFTWLDADGKLIGKLSVPHQETRVIAIGEESVLYTCGRRRNQRPECLALKPGVEEPLWQVQLEGRTAIVGGAVVPAMLYVATQDGGLYAIGG